MVKDDLKLLIPERNIVTVETFRNGKLRQRARTHNMITQPGLDWLKYKRDSGLNTGIAAGKNTHKVPLDYFNTLVALKDSSAPAINENYNLSNVIAWANKTAYTGADTKRGTVNLVESYCTDDLIHWAIDFPTHAGNMDIINSIAWEYCMTTSDYIIGGQEAVISFSIPISGARALCFDGSHFWTGVLDGGKKITIYKLSKLGAVLSTYGPFASGLTSNLSDVLVINNTAYITEWNGGSYKKVTIIPLSGIGITTKTLAYACSAITYDGTNIWGLQHGLATIAKFDLSMNLISTISTPVPVFDIRYDPINNTIFGSVSDESCCYILDMSGMTLNKIYYTIGGNNYKRFMNINGVLYAVSTVTNKVYVINYNSLGARALLPVPIQKTAADTMRITYDFDIRF